MKEIFKTYFGSTLYGSTTPTSDVDIKGVFIPNARQIILGTDENFNNRRSKNKFEKNEQGEIEEEYFSLKMYLSLISEGQTMGLDILFAPKESWIGDASSEWLELLNNKDKLLSKDSTAFIGYCETQSRKYGAKGSRVSSLEKALEVMSSTTLNLKRTRLKELRETIQDLVDSGCPHMSVFDVTHPSGYTETFWEICDKKFSFNCAIEHPFGVIDNMRKEAGSRSVKASQNNGVDFKAISHCVRILSESVELLTTGHITFPLPNAKRVTEIKLGNIPYEEVEVEIAELYDDVEKATKRSVLPDHCDQEWIENFLYDTYRKYIV